MESRNKRLELLKAVCANDAHALTFLVQAHIYFLTLRKFLVEHSKDPHGYISLMAQTDTVFSLPYFVRHADTLKLVVLRALTDADPMLPIVESVAILQLGYDGARKLLAKAAETE